MLILKATKDLSTVTLVLTLILSGFLIDVGKTKEQEVGTSASAKTLISKSHLSAANAQQQQPLTHRKRALLVGISKYKRIIKSGTAWEDLKGLAAKNDLELLANILVRQFQFKPEDIKIISDEPINLNGKTISPVNPTHKEIVDTFRSFLIAQAQPGDVAFFHFSGHGQQVPDDNRDELDGYDETLVPLDYVSMEDGKNNIRDDEIGGLLGELRKKNPSHVLVSIDSCYSGTAIRGDYDEFRGGSWKGMPVPKEKIRGEDESINDLLGRANRGEQPLRNYVFLSAASSRQQAVHKSFCMDNEDCKVYGVFTHALAKAMKASGPTTTYRDVYERVRAEVSRDNDQQPQIEGDQLDRIFLQDGALPAESYIPVEVNKFNENEFTLSAGSLQGITVGSRFALYPTATKSRDEGKPLLEAQVIKVWATDSTLKAVGDVTPDAVKNAARAFEVSHNYESILKVALKDVSGFTGLDEMLKKLGLVATVPESNPSWNVLIRAVVQADRDEKIVPSDFRGVILQRRGGKSIIAKVEEGKEMAEKIRDALISEAKRITLISLDDSNPNLKVELRLIPVEVEWHLNSFRRAEIDKVIGDKKERLQYSKSGSIEFKLNDWYRLEVRNLSKSDVYITILNLDANGQISPAFPRFDKNNLIESAGKSTNKGQGWMPIEGLYIRITEPLGLESLHAIATEEQTDFSPLFDPGIINSGRERGDSFNQELLNEVVKKRTQRGDNDAAQRLETAIKSPLGQIFIAAQEGRGIRGPASPPPSWSTATVSYRVVK